MTYEDWCRAWVHRDPLSHKREFGRILKAEAKRERKAAKRRRDAELTRLGAEASAAWVELVSLWSRDHDLGRAALMKRMSAQALMRAIRRGGAVP